MLQKVINDCMLNSQLCKFAFKLIINLIVDNFLKILGVFKCKIPELSLKNVEILFVTAITYFKI